MRNVGRTCILGAAILFGPRLAQAAESAPLPQGTVSQASASAGSTELGGQGQFATVTEAPPTDVTEAEVSAGGLLSTGNARAGSITAAGRFLLRRRNHQFSAAVAGNYGRAAANAQADVETTVSNVQGLVRYDYFAHRRLSLFVMLTPRHDTFQGLNLRLNVDPGLAVYILEDLRNRLWVEAGYDFQYELRTDEAIRVKNADGTDFQDVNGRTISDESERERFTHAVRLFGGYRNNINERVTFGTSLEYLQSVLQARRYRINWDTALSANLVQRLAIALTFTVRLDNDPAPGIQKVDTITAASLIYRFF